MFTTILIKKDGKLVAETESKRALYKEFIKNLPDHTRLEVFMDFAADDGTTPQLAKIHACIREIAITMGETPAEVKEDIKRRCNLTLVDHGDKTVDILLLKHVKSLNDYQVHKGKIDGEKNLLFRTHDKSVAEKIVKTYNSKSKEKYKSFADCSKDELSLVIQTIIEVGDFLGINFR
jgi:hypothetical protein